METYIYIQDVYIHVYTGCYTPRCNSDERLTKNGGCVTHSVSYPQNFTRKPVHAIEPGRFVGSHVRN